MDQLPTGCIYLCLAFYPQRTAAPLILKMNPLEESIPEEWHNQPKPSGLKEEKTIIHAAEKRLVTTILVGLIGAIFGIIGHYLLLIILNGRRAEAQFWIKTVSNAFSQVVVLSMGLVMTSSLTQSVRLTDIDSHMLTHSQGLAGIDSGAHPDLSHRRPLFPSIAAIYSLHRCAEKVPGDTSLGHFSRHSSTGRSDHPSPEFPYR